MTEPHDAIAEGTRGRAGGASATYQRFSMRYLLQIVFRRKRVVILPVVLTTVLAAGVTQLLPKKYVASTSILLGQDEVLNPLVKWQTAVSLSVADYMMSFQKIVYSRTLLEQVIEELELVPMPPDPLEVDVMLGKLRGSVGTSVSGSDSFSIVTTWSDPHLAKEITELVANLFIGKSLEGGRKEATAAVGFIRDQLRVYRRQLVEAEDRLRTYKEQNPDKLPEQHRTYMGDLQKFRSKLAENAVVAKELSLRIDLIEKRLNGEEPMVVRSATFLNSSPLQTHLEEKAIEVEEKRSRMKDTHPDLLRVESEYRALRDMRSREKMSKEATQTEEVRSPVYQELMAKLQDTRIELETATMQADEYRAIIADLEAKVAEIPRSEMVLTAMQREVANLGELYETLRAKVEHAKVSQQVELQSQENRFQILDPARVPLRHASPNAPMITVAGFVGGVFLGVGLIFLFEFLDQAVVREEEMVFVFDETILATIPKLHV